MGSAISRPQRRGPNAPYLAAFLAASAVEADDGATSADAPAVEPAADKSGTSQSFTSMVKEATPASAPARSSSWGWWNFQRPELPNPGAYEEMAQESYTVLHQPVQDGLNFNMTVPSPSGQSANGISFDLGARERPPSFAVLSNYYSNTMLAITRLSPNDGTVSGRVFYRHTPGLTSKLMGEVSVPQPLSSKVTWELDYRGSDYSATLKAANVGVIAMSYLQSVTPWLALGGEGFYQQRSKFSALTLAAKYRSGKETATISWATFGPMMCTYSRKVNSKCTLAAEFQADTRSRESLVTLGYRFDLRNSAVTGTVDSTGKVAAIMEERVSPNCTLSLSGELDHAKEDYRFGVGVTFGQ